MSWQLRRGMKHTRAVGLATALAQAFLASAAFGTSAPMGAIVQTVAGPGQNTQLFDWQIAKLIDQHFTNDGSGAGVVDADILIISTLCYGGTWGHRFNSTLFDNSPPPPTRPSLVYGGGNLYDGVQFSNTTFMSAHSAGMQAIYTGFHDDAASALVPGFTALGVFAAGFDGRGSDELGTEMPLLEGNSLREIGGSSSTHVLVWMSQPEALDTADADAIIGNFGGHPGAEVSVLSGSQASSVVGNVRKDSATIANFTSEIARIGPLITAGEQFIMFLGDHGAISYKSVSSAPVGAKTTPAGEPSNAMVDVGFDLGSFFIADLTDSPGEDASVQLATADTIPDPSLLSVSLNGNDLGTLAGATLSSFDFPSLGVLDTYSLALPDSALLPTDIQTLRVTNNDTATGYTFEQVSFDSGAIPNLPFSIPLPSLTLLGYAAVATLILATALHATRRRPIGDWKN